MAHQSPRIEAIDHITLRGDTYGRLTVDAVERQRWRLRKGSRVTVALMGCGSWQSGVPEAVGRIVAEAGVAAVAVTAHPNFDSETFVACMTRSAQEYLGVVFEP